MFDLLLAPLLESLRLHFTLSKSRLVTLAVMMVGLANCRTVNLSHLASQCPGTAQHAPSYCQLQRFFQHIRLNGATVARLVVRMLGPFKVSEPTTAQLRRWSTRDRMISAASARS